MVLLQKRIFAFYFLMSFGNCFFLPISFSLWCMLITFGVRLFFLFLLFCRCTISRIGASYTSNVFMTCPSHNVISPWKRISGKTKDKESARKVKSDFFCILNISSNVKVNVGENSGNFFPPLKWSTSTQ